MMRFNDAYDNRITLRLSDKQYDFVCSLSDTLEISNSDLIRMFIDSFLIRQEQKEVSENAF